MCAGHNASKNKTAVEKGVGEKALFFLGGDENRCDSRSDQERYSCLMIPAVTVQYKRDNLLVDHLLW
jgi:hypothetical protein